MNDLRLIARKIEELVIKEGYTPTLDYSINLSGYEIYKYFIEKSELYKLGFSGTPLLSYAIPRMIYDGIAYMEYMSWDILPSKKSYYYFRYYHGMNLDITYGAMSLEEIGDIDYLIVYEFFKKIESFCKSNLVEDYYINDDDNYQGEPDEKEDIEYLFERMHLLGRSIYKSWKNGLSPRFKFVKKIIDDYINPRGI